MLKKLNEWWRRVAMAMWFHPEFDLAKRQTLAGAAALVAVTLVATSVSSIGTFAVPKINGVVPRGPIAAELTPVIRRAFMPRIYVQLYKSAPLISELLAQA
jgi:hypothetical protein